MTRKDELVKFRRPSSMYSMPIEAVRMCRNNVLTAYVIGAKGEPEECDLSQIEIRVLPDGSIEIFHDDHMSIDVKPFSEYYTPKYADFEKKS